MQRQKRNHTACYRVTGKPVDGALISFSGMESDSAHFSQPGVFVSFVGTKEREV